MRSFAKTITSSALSPMTQMANLMTFSCTNYPAIYLCSLRQFPCDFYSPPISITATATKLLLRIFIQVEVLEMVGVPNK